jgi:EAL and modified HD-GYP domain-containing signal transduction protein
MSIGLDDRKAVSVARHPILDQSGHIFGYELLYRGESEAADSKSASENGESTDDLAGARVLTDGILAVGLDALTCGLRAFVKLTHHLLIDGAATLLPPETTVLELDAAMEVTPDVLETCKRLRDAGYRLALDNYQAARPVDALLPLVSFLKVDVLRTPEREWTAIPARMKSKTIQLIAEHVETPEAAAAARKAGYDFFQGYYFCRPTTFARTPLPARRLAYLTLLSALNRDDLSLDRIEDLVKHDVSLSYRVLRSVNSAAFGLREEVTSIRRALMLLGLMQIRRWASVWSLAGLSDGGMPETVSVALVRARSCELIGETMSSDDSGSYFLLGMCSLLDVILQRPMADVLTDMPLPVAIKDALFGTQNEARHILDAVIAHERAEWDEARAAAGRAGCPDVPLPRIYADALRWTREISLQSKPAAA